MRVSLNGGLYVLLRTGSKHRKALGFKIKPRAARLFSEREGLRKGFCVGPVYFGLY